jgi:hypothetical protein
MSAGFGIDTLPEADLEPGLGAFSGRIIMGIDL